MIERLALIAALAPGAAAAAEVDVELVVAVDMSGSMDVEEKALQRAGYVAAFRSPELQQAIAEGAYRRIAVAYLEWAGSSSQVVVVDWTLIDGPESAEAFADTLEAQPLSRIRGTSISGAIDYAAAMFDDNGFEGWRRVIDVSGDGPNNRGRAVTEARDAALERGVAINGLPIMLRPSRASGALDAYYAACVVGGPGAFVLPVRAREEFAEAIRRKLVLEVAGLTPPPTVLPAQYPPDGGDCLVGERLRRLWSDP